VSDRIRQLPSPPVSYGRLVGEWADQRHQARPPPSAPRSVPPSTSTALPDCDGSLSHSPSPSRPVRRSLGRIRPGSVAGLAFGQTIVPQAEPGPRIERSAGEETGRIGGSAPAESLPIARESLSTSTAATSASSTAATSEAEPRSLRLCPTSIRAGRSLARCGEWGDGGPGRRGRSSSWRTSWSRGG
jgi:hypothetical protein